MNASEEKPTRLRRDVINQQRAEVIRSSDAFYRQWLLQMITVAGGSLTLLVSFLHVPAAASGTWLVPTAFGLLAASLVAALIAFYAENYREQKYWNAINAAVKKAEDEHAALALSGVSKELEAWRLENAILHGYTGISKLLHYTNHAVLTLLCGGLVCVAVFAVLNWKMMTK